MTPQSPLRRKEKCPLEGEVTLEECVGCYGSLKHVPCPLDLHNPTFVKECLRTTIKELTKTHPDWVKV